MSRSRGVQLLMVTSLETAATGKILMRFELNSRVCSNGQAAGMGVIHCQTIPSQWPGQNHVTPLFGSKLLFRASSLLLWHFRVNTVLDVGERC